MQLGNLLIELGLAASITSFCCYLGLTLGYERFKPYARQFYIIATICVVGVSAMLLTFMVTNRFDVKYVHDFSSLSQPLLFKISGFWGGQEGSWQLWLTWISLVGLFLARRTAYAEGPAMAFWTSLQSFFLIVSLTRSPFVPMPMHVTDGVGLNPLLQNYWMAIHPPILFMGFTLISVPAAFAVAALIQKDYNRWSKLVFGWAVLGWTVLGIGVLLGGIWAYETLGWGGWWGWDPVENASFVPWLIGGGLIHGLMLERTKGSWKRLNLFLAFASFLMVIYATFLTRSGVLGDFSVHSFASLGHNNWLLGFLLGYTALAIGLIAFRTHRIDQADAYDEISSKEFLVFLGVVVFGLAGILVAIGMSSPILSRFLLGKAGNVPTIYYYRVMIPIALAILALSGLSPLFSWARSRSIASLSNKRWITLVVSSLAIGLLVSAYVWSRTDAEIGARTAIGWFALTILAPNLWSLYDTIKRQGYLVSGGHIAHVGLSIFFLGMLVATHNNKARPDRLDLAANQPQHFQGRTWTFLGIGDSAQSGRQPLRIRVEKPNGDAFVATPTMQDVRDGTMRHPYIRRSFAGDLYIAPVDTEMTNLPPHNSLVAGQTKKVGPWTVKFLSFAGMQPMPDGSVHAGARFYVSDASGRHTATVVPVLTMTSTGNMQYSPAALPGSKDSLVVANISVPNNQVGVVLDGPKYRQALQTRAIIEVTFKPLVWLLWLGAFIIAVGGATSTFRRIREARTMKGQSVVDQINQIREVRIGGSAIEQAPIK